MKDDDLFLNARRPNGQDDADPGIAFALSRADAAAAESRRGDDALIAAKLAQVAPPDGLRERILAGGRVSRRPSWFERKVWRSFRMGELLAAAAVVLLIGAALVINFLRRDGSGEKWQLAAIGKVAEIEAGRAHLASQLSDITGIRSWLVDNTCPAPGALPAPVQKLPIFGCSKLDWNGAPMSIVCFDLGGGREVHLVTVATRHLPAAPPADVPLYEKVGDYETASWSEGKIAMMLVGKIPRGELEGFFRTTTTAASAQATLLASATEF